MAETKLTVEETLKAFDKKQSEILWHNRLQTLALIFSVLGVGAIFEMIKHKKG